MAAARGGGRRPGGMYPTAGLMHEGGIGTEKNPAEAFLRWHGASQTSDMSRAYAHTKNLLSDGHRHRRQSRRAPSPAASWRKPNLEGMYYLGMLYQFGKDAEDPWRRMPISGTAEPPKRDTPDGMYMTGWCLKPTVRVGDEALGMVSPRTGRRRRSCGADIAWLELQEKTKAPLQAGREQESTLPSACSQTEAGKTDFRPV